ncbi:MAG: DUF5678 domain-containing protein [Euryarchaeota archaeon]|nr:DUF5678 domain-containing protein [Euryarchaeota archaeon]
MSRGSIRWDELKKYSGSWVAVADEKVLASGKSLKDVMGTVEAINRKVEVFQVPEEEEVYVLASDL